MEVGWLQPAMASRYRSVSQPAFSLIKSTITKPASKPVPSSFLLKTRSPVTARQVRFGGKVTYFLGPNWISFHFVYLRSGGWVVSSVACSLCFPFTRRCHQRASHLVWALIPVGRGRCLRVCFAVPTPEFDFSEFFFTLLLSVSIHCNFPLFSLSIVIVNRW